MPESPRWSMKKIESGLDRGSTEPVASFPADFISKLWACMEFFVYFGSMDGIFVYFVSMHGIFVYLVSMHGLFCHLKLRWYVWHAIGMCLFFGIFIIQSWGYIFCPAWYVFVMWVWQWKCYTLMLPYLHR